MAYYTDQIGGGIGVEPQGYFRNDDESFGPFPLGFNLTYFGQEYDQFFINTNGNISFGQDVGTFTPQSLDTTAIAPIIAPYWADIDTRPSSGGTVTLRNDIPNQVIITWDQVGYFSSNTDKLASLQLVLRGPDFNVPPGEGDIGFFYKDIQWETGDRSGGIDGFGGTQATAGFGDGLLTVNPGEVAIAGSQQPGISQSLSNTSVWFQLGQGGIPIGNEATQTTVPTNAIQGTKWEDVDGNGVRDGDDLVSGDRPNVVFVVDVSGSTDNPFVGTPVGDLNQDGDADTILDAEIAAVKALNDALIARGLGQTAQVSIVSFSSSAAPLDMDPNAPGNQLFTTPEADSDGNGVRDVEEIAQGLRDVGGTNFSSGLQEAINAVNNLNPPSSANVIFLSDGQDSSSVADEVTELQNLGVNLRAFGVGNGADLGQLQTIDSNAQIFSTTDELLGVFGGQGGGTAAFTDPPIPGVTIYLDLNSNGSPDAGEPTAVTGATGEYIFPDLAPGTYTVREIVPNGFSQTFPAGGAHIVTVGTDNTEGLDFGNFQNQESTLEFSFPFYQTGENGTPVVTVTRTGGTGSVSATVSLNPVTAQPGLDYQNVSFPVTFPDGDFQPKTVPIPLIDDDEFEEVERANLTLIDIQGTAVLGPQGTAILEILDNDTREPTTLEFSSSFFQTTENGTPIVTITRSGGTGPVSATVSLNPVTAQPGLDYQNVSFPVTFPDGDFQPKAVPIPLIDDDEFEEVERANLTLIDIQGSAVLGPQGTAILEILDNDTREPATLEFSSSFYQTSENGTPIVTITRSGGSEAVSATVSLLPATAQPGLDYQEVSIPVSFAEGDFQPKTVSIPLIDDDEFEEVERANLTLIDIQGSAVLGPQGTAILEILDNDIREPATLEFSSSFFQTTEDGTATIVVTRTGGSEAVSATVSLLPATATGGLDYQEVSIPVSFAEGDFQPKTVSIPLIDDAEFEGTEQANLTLSDIEGNAIPGLQGTAALQIIDNEPPPPSAALPPATIGPNFEGLGNFTRITDLQGVAVSPNAITLVARDSGGLGFFDSGAVPVGNTVVGYDTGQSIVLDLAGILSQRPGAPTGVQSGTISFAYASPNVTQTVTFRDRNRNILSQQTLPLTIPGPNGEFNQFQQFETALPPGTQIIELGSQATEIVFNDIRLNADSNTAPTDIILTNNTIPENAPRGTVVGDLIAVDAEGNNTQNFTLLDSAGDRFQIFGNLLTVINDELLDFESSTSHSITVQTTDTSGEFFDESFAINITNVPEEVAAPIPTPVSAPIGQTDPGNIIPTLTASDVFAGF